MKVWPFGSSIGRSIVALTVILVSLILVRLAYGILSFPHLATEDNYQLLVYGNTIKAAGELFSSYGLIEPRVQAAPPLIPLFLAGWLYLAPGEDLTGMLIFAFVGQVLALVFIFMILRSIGLRYSWALAGSLLPLALYRFVWVTSLSAPDSLLVGLGAMSGWLFLQSVKDKSRTIYLASNFATLTVLSWIHNFGLLLAAISALAYLVVIAKDYSHRFLGHVLIGTSAWALISLPRLQLAASVYVPSVIHGAANPGILAGESFLESFLSYYGLFPLLVLVPLGVLFVLGLARTTRGIILFLLWFVANLTVLTIIPLSFSHISRYPLELLTPLVILIVTGLTLVYVRLKRLRIPFQSRPAQKVFASFLVLSLSVPLIHGALYEGPDLIEGGKDFLVSSYGVREGIGGFLRTEYPNSPILSMYYPSLLTGYGGLPSENLIDYAILAMNNDDLLAFALDRGISLFLFDRLSGLNYPFPERARDILSPQPLQLQEVHVWSTRAILYQVSLPKSYSVTSVLLSEPGLATQNLSAPGFQVIDGGPHGLIRPGEYSFRVLESTEGSVVVPVGANHQNATLLFSVALRMPPDAHVNLNITCEGREVGEKSIVAPSTSTQVWWFDYYSIELGPLASSCSALTLSIQTDAPGAVHLHRLQLLAFGDLL